MGGVGSTPGPRSGLTGMVYGVCVPRSCLRKYRNAISKFIFPPKFQKKKNALHFFENPDLFFKKKQRKPQLKTLKGSDFFTLLFLIIVS